MFIFGKTKLFWIVALICMFSLFIKFAYYNNHKRSIYPNAFSRESDSQFPVSTPLFNVSDSTLPTTTITTATTTTTASTLTSTFNSITSQIHVGNDGDFRFSRKFENITYTGKFFDKKWDKYLKELDLYDVKQTDDKTILHSRPVIICGVSSNHFGEARTMMKYIGDLYNDTKILYIYDLGLNDDHLAEINGTYNETVVEVRKFPFYKYPKYVENLGEFRWKPLVIAEMLLEFPVVWYMDSSIQFRKSVDVVYESIEKCLGNFDTCSTYPWILVEWTGHSIHSATNPKMYDYLPIPDYWSKNISMYAGGLELIYGLKSNKENVLRYWVLCALQKDCMGPEGAQTYCSFGQNRFIQYANCHRYDQSAINILVSWITGFREDRFNHKVTNENIKVVRGRK